MYPQENVSCGSLFKVLIKQSDTKLANIIHKYNSDKWSKKLSTKDQLEILVSANLAQSKSLSDISSMVGGTNRFNSSSIHKSSLSRVNERRDCQIFEELYLNLLSQIRKRIIYSNLRVIDTTTEIVSKLLFPLWPWDSDRGAVRVTLMFDPNYELPDQITFGTGKDGDTTLVKNFEIKKGITYLFDAGFREYNLYAKIISKGSFFITRQHKRVHTKVLESLPITESDVVSDQIVILGVDDARWKMKEKTRLIVFYTHDQKIMLISTNRFDLTTKQIRDLYRRRWDIEVFFKFLKQNLKLKKFYGVSINAIKTQIYCALIAYLLVFLLKPKHAHMTEFLRKIKYSLFLPFHQLSFFDSS